MESNTLILSGYDHWAEQWTKPTIKPTSFWRVEKAGSDSIQNMNFRKNSPIICNISSISSVTI